MIDVLLNKMLSLIHEIFEIASCVKLLSFKCPGQQQYPAGIGISNESFDELCSYIKEYVRNTPTRTSRTSLGIFLFKMKFGISNKVPSTILSMSRSSLRRAISSVGEALMQTCVPQNLGLQHIEKYQEKSY
jgi:hypothetical protein